MGEVVGGQNQLHPGQRADFGEIADPEPSMSVRGAQKARSKAVGRKKVGSIPALPGYEFCVLNPLYRLTDAKLHRLHIVPQSLIA
jgi:hypothetical protein